MENEERTEMDAHAALLTQRDDVCALLGALRAEESAAFTRLDRIDASLRRIEGHSLVEPRRSQETKGAFTRRLLRALKGSERPLTLTEITRACGEEPCDGTGLRAARRRVSRLLTRLAEQEVLRRAPCPTGAPRWELNR